MIDAQIQTGGTSNSATFTDEAIGRALYEVNKAAKRHRDHANEAYEANDMSMFREHRRQQSECYALKNRVIYAAVRRGWATLDSVHLLPMKYLHCTIEGDFAFDRPKQSACVRIGGLLFHIACDVVDSSHEPISLPKDWISVAVPEGTMMPLWAAETLLKQFLAEDYDDELSEISINGAILRRNTGARIQRGEPCDGSGDEMAAVIDTLEASLDRSKSRIKILEAGLRDCEDASAEEDEFEEDDMQKLEEEWMQIKEDLSECRSSVELLTEANTFTEELAMRLNDVKLLVLDLWVEVCDLGRYF